MYSVVLIIKTMKWQNKRNSWNEQWKQTLWGSHSISMVNYEERVIPVSCGARNLLCQDVPFEGGRGRAKCVSQRNCVCCQRSKLNIHWESESDQKYHWQNVKVIIHWESESDNTLGKFKWYYTVKLKVIIHWESESDNTLAKWKLS